MFYFVFYIFYIVVVVCGCWQNGPPPCYWFLVIQHLFCTPILILGLWTSSRPWMWLTIQTGVLFTNYFPEYFWVTISMLIKSNVKKKMMKKFFVYSSCTVLTDCSHMKLKPIPPAKNQCLVCW